jgi:hypothetical protein
MEDALSNMMPKPSSKAGPEPGAAVARVEATSNAGKRAAGHEAFSGLSSPRPCTACGSAVYWQDPYDKVRCAGCDAATLPEEIRGTWLVVVRVDGGTAWERSGPAQEAAEHPQSEVFWHNGEQWYAYTADGREILEKASFYRERLGYRMIADPDAHEAGLAALIDWNRRSRAHYEKKRLEAERRTAERKAAQDKPKTGHRRKRAGPLPRKK